LTISSVSRTCESRVKNFRKKLGLATPLSRAGTEEAADQFRAAIALDPQFTAAYVSLDFKRSERLLRASLVLDPLNPETHYMLAVVLRAVGRLDEAEAAARRCLSISPTYVFGHYILGNILTMQGREESVAECQLEVPEGGQLTCLAKAYYKLGRAKEADTMLTVAMQLHGLDHAYWIASVFGYIRQEDRAFEWL
jgi:tetratricopeptide (TPR) repeat protein